MGKLAYFSLTLLSAVIAVSSFDLGPTDVVFHLFTRENPRESEPLWPTEDSLIRSTQFDMNRKTVITIHSSGENVSGNFNAFVIPAYLEVDDVNLFAIDWSLGSSMYTIGLGNAPQLGRIIARFMNILVDNFGYPADQIIIVGVGLGGHIAGIAARNINGNIPHIFALDPSLYGWPYSEEKLNPDDAEVVEVLHTTAGAMGYDLPLGDLDFYPNGGSVQAGCPDTACSHTYSYAFFAESLKAEVEGGNKFVGTACDSYEQAATFGCNGARDVVFGGTGDKTGSSGVYTFFTNFVEPFARG